MLCDGGAVSRALAGLASALALAACSGGGGPRMYVPRDLPRTANPSAVVAAELAFARAAQDKGQWTAFADYAADDAVMGVPEPVNAKDWLRKQQNPPRAVTWQPHQVWSSCDGSLAVTKGAWQRPDGSVGAFTTVWERQKDGGYKWVLDVGETLDSALAEPEMVAAEVAVCGVPAQVANFDDGPKRGAVYIWEMFSKDRTLRGVLYLNRDNKGTLVFDFSQEDGRPIPSTQINAAAE